MVVQQPPPPPLHLGDGTILGPRVFPNSVVGEARCQRNRCHRVAGPKWQHRHGLEEAQGDYAADPGMGSQPPRQYTRHEQGGHA